MQKKNFHFRTKKCKISAMLHIFDYTRLKKFYHTSPTKIGKEKELKKSDMKASYYFDVDEI